MSHSRGLFLDHNASHPLLQSVRSRLAQDLENSPHLFSNPMSIHTRGRDAKRVVYEAKLALTQILGVPQVDELVFNSGATEGINTVLKGFCSDIKSQARVPVLLYSAVEHSAVLDTLETLEGVQRFEIPVASSGQLDTQFIFETFERELQDPLKDILLVLQVANNETGHCFDFSFQQELHLRFGPQLQLKKPKIKGGKFPSTPRRFWTLLDGAQALGKTPEEHLRRALHFADYLVLSAHKIGGPTGVGALYMKGHIPFSPLLTGGAQEKKRRAGTHNILGIRGFHYAVEDWIKNGATYRKKFQDLHEVLCLKLSDIEGLHLHLKENSKDEFFMHNTLNFHVEGCLEEGLLVGLDLEGVFVSSGSACNSGSLKPSKVLLAMGYPEDVALASVRVSVGVETTMTDVESFVETLRRVVDRIRKARQLSAELLPRIDLPSSTFIR